MAPVRPFSALRYVNHAEHRFGWGAAPAAAPPPLHSGQLSRAADPQALLRGWAEQGELAAETPGLYVVQTRPLAPRPGRSDAPALFLVGAMELDGLLAPLEEEAPEATGSPAECVPVLAADDQQALLELLTEVAQGAPRAIHVSEGREVRLWKIDDAALWRRAEDVLSEMILRPLQALPAQGRVLVAITPVFGEALDVRPLHRGLAHLGTFQAERFLAVVKDYARVYELDAPLAGERGLEAARARMAALATRSHAVLLMLPGGQGRILRFRQDLGLAQLKAAPRNPTLRSLDLALLEAVVFQTVLGLREPSSRTHPNLFPVATAARLLEQVAEGTFQAGFALNPPPRWELRAVMEAAQSLPPRTLYLEAAPPAGLLFLAP